MVSVVVSRWHSDLWGPLPVHAYAPRGLEVWAKVEGEDKHEVCLIVLSRGHGPHPWPLTHVFRQDVSLTEPLLPGVSPATGAGAVEGAAARSGGSVPRAVEHPGPDGHAHQASTARLGLRGHEWHQFQWRACFWYGTT